LIATQRRAHAKAKKFDVTWLSMYYVGFVNQEIRQTRSCTAKKDRFEDFFADETRRRAFLFNHLHTKRWRIAQQITVTVGISTVFAAD